MFIFEIFSLDSATRAGNKNFFIFAFHNLNSNDNLGLVVGGTSANEISQIRKVVKDLPFLIPGIGAQGGDLENSFRSGNTDGIALINVSRGIIFAGDLSAKAIRKEAKRYVETMQSLT